MGAFCELFLAVCERCVRYGATVCKCRAGMFVLTGENSAERIIGAVASADTVRMTPMDAVLTPLPSHPDSLLRGSGRWYPLGRNPRPNGTREQCVGRKPT
ncbi:hypothetical protein NDU88_001772 [Pleurodeles waltl]|uniref:Uncharacterized protein n=1 Tax=Pleurodeles waltl TaxID=8319 RepID=A0AAV7U9D9_PLEWA|nr:hypothetical protein NDU88_001772 [Pleurodeles waltl]